LNLTALDIDGIPNIEEFDQIEETGSASATYESITPNIKLTEPAPGVFMGQDVDQVNQTGVDTSSLLNMFTVSNSNVSTFRAKLGMQTFTPQTTQRLYSLYSKTFNYVAMSTLQVSYSAFNAYTVDNASVYLNWVTQNETNNNYFEIQRSFDGKAFQTIANVLSNKSNSSGSNSYNFKDQSEELNGHPVLYYRIGKVNGNENYSYSPVKVVHFVSGGNATNMPVEVYPDPYTESINLNFNTIYNGPALVKMLDARGSQVLSQSAMLKSGYNTIQVKNLSAQNKGIYFVEVVIKSGLLFTQKVFKN